MRCTTPGSIIPRYAISVEPCWAALRTRMKRASKQGDEPFPGFQSGGKLKFCPGVINWVPHGPT